MKVTFFPDFFHCRSIFNTCNFLWSCNYTITYKINSVTHRCTGFFIIDISHITLAPFFSFLTWLGLGQKYVCVGSNHCFLSLFPALSSSHTQSLSLFFFFVILSLLTFDEFDDPPPPLSLISFLLNLFSFTLLSFLLCFISLFYPPSYHFYSALLLSLP